MGGGTGRRRAAVTALLLLALLAAVGLASRAHTAGGGGSARVLDSDILLEYTLLLVAAAGVVVIPLTVYAFVVGRQDEEIALPPRRNWMLAVLLTMSAIAVVSVVLLAGGYLRHHHRAPSSAPLAPLLNLAGKGTRAPRAVAFDWVPVIVVSTLAVAALGAGGLMVARRRRPSRTPGIAGALVLALDETLDDLRGDLDPRTHGDRRIRADGACACALRAPTLAVRGAARVPRRVLPGVGAGAGSIERLTDLYERARFSTHEIDAGDEGRGDHCPGDRA